MEEGFVLLLFHPMTLLRKHQASFSLSSFEIRCSSLLIMKVFLCTSLSYTAHHNYCTNLYQQQWLQCSGSECLWLGIMANLP